MRFLAAMFIRENIAIIRMGLQPTELISEGGEVVAGPFHPSFRQLVDSRLVLGRLNGYWTKGNGPEVES